MRPERSSAMLLSLLLVGLSCAHSPPEPSQQGLEARIEAHADQIMAAAAALEPETTPMLKSLAEGVGGEMYKLEHRLKTRESLLRKLKKIAKKDPSKPVEDIEINDALRYTMRVDDDPPGLHAKTIKDVLEKLEAKGNKVVKLKNYWPKGDNYSGINTVMKHESGLLWELQFHTSASLDVQTRTHELYEELRVDATPLQRRKAIFEEMAQEWEDVAIPEGILIPKALHPSEQILQMDAPQK